MSPDEQVAVDALTGTSGMPAPDLAVGVLDATALSRSLYLLSMVVELGLPTVVALAMNDLAFSQWPWRRYGTVVPSAGWHAGRRGRRAYRRRRQGIGRCHRGGFPGTPPFPMG